MTPYNKKEKSKEQLSLNLLFPVINDYRYDKDFAAFRIRLNMYRYGYTTF